MFLFLLDIFLKNGSVLHNNLSRDSNMFMSHQGKWDGESADEVREQYYWAMWHRSARSPVSDQLLVQWNRFVHTTRTCSTVLVTLPVSRDFSKVGHATSCFQWPYTLGTVWWCMQDSCWRENDWHFPQPTPISPTKHSLQSFSSGGSSRRTHLWEANPRCSVSVHCMATEPCFWWQISCHQHRRGTLAASWFSSSRPTNSERQTICLNGNSWRLGLVQGLLWIPIIMEGRVEVSSVFQMWSSGHWTSFVLQGQTRFVCMGYRVWQPGRFHYQPNAAKPKSLGEICLSMSLLQLWIFMCQISCMKHTCIHAH